MTTIDMFRNATDTIAFRAGDVIFNAGDAADYMYVIVDGEVDIVVGGKAVDMTGPGGIFGEMALIDTSPRSAAAVARTDCRVVAINERRFTFLVQQTPFFSVQVMRIMAERLRRWISLYGSTPA
jgi:CRP-like cAMP-binding protein